MSKKNKLWCILTGKHEMKMISSTHDSYWQTIILYKCFSCERFETKSINGKWTHEVLEKIHEDDELPYVEGD